MNNVDVSFSATLQPRVSYGLDQTDGEADVERFGFGIRRARFRITAEFSDLLGIYYDVDFGGGNLTSVSLYTYYEPSSRLRLRAGYVPGAQPEAYTPTSHTKLDLIDRAAIAENWSRITFGPSGRDFGVDATYQFEGGDITLFAHRGDGNFNRQRGNFRQSVSGGSATGGVGISDVAVSGAIVLKDLITEGVQLGGFASYNASANPHTAVDEIGRNYVSYSAHAYYGKAPGSQAFRIKLDVIGISFEELTEEDGAIVAAQNWLGFSGMGAVRLLPSLELVARAEQMMPDNGGADMTYLGGGLHFSPSAFRGLSFHRERISLMYVNAMPDGSSAHLIELQGQLAF